MSTLILVTAATGVQGGSTAREPLAKNVPVRAFVRDPTSKAALDLQSLGAELVKGEFNDVSSINAAVAGVTGIFLNPCPSFTDPDAEVGCAKNFVAAALAEGTVKTFVVSTVYKSREKVAQALTHPEWPFLSYYYSRKAGIEEAVLAGGFENTTILRPGWLTYNYLSPMWFPEFKADHTLTVSYERNYKHLHFDGVDVGKFASAAFQDPARFKGIIELVWEQLTFEEAAKIISRVSGVEVKARVRTEQETKALTA